MSARAIRLRASTLMLETLALILLATITVLLWALVSRLSRLESRLDPLRRLDEIKSQVVRLAEAGGDIELRRLEHVLIDIRDGQKRLEERLLQLAESPRSAEGDDAAPTRPRDLERPSAAGLSERITNRLLAMGYERIQVLTPFEELTRLQAEAGDGEVQVEARRAGAVCKGRVAVRKGVIAAVELKASHAMFP